MAAYLLASYQLNGTSEDKFLEIIYYESTYDEKVYDYTLDLLMPDHLFNSIIEYEDEKFMAKIFNVSDYLIVKKLEKKQKKRF